MSASTSATFAAAIDAWRECREAYALHLEAAYERADRACRGVLLNHRGRLAGISSESLFLGPRTRAYAYASDELRDHWTEHPRVTFAEFERQWVRS